MESILRTDLKYLNKENKKASHKFVKTTIIISLFLFLFIVVLLLTEYGTENVLKQKYKDGYAYVTIEADLNDEFKEEIKEYNYSCLKNVYIKNLGKLYANHQTVSYYNNVLSFFDTENDVKNRYNYKYATNDFSGAILSYSNIKSMTKQKPESFLGSKFSFILTKDGDNGEIIKEEIEIPITNIYYDNNDYFQNDKDGYIYLINSNYLSEELETFISTTYYEYMLKEKIAKSLDLEYVSYDIVIKKLNSNTADMFVFLKTYSIVFIIMLLAAFCLFVFIFNNSIKKSFRIRSLIGGRNKYIKNLKTIYILEKSLISIGITSLIAIISFIILSKLMFVQIFMGIMLKYIGFIILAYLAMFIIMAIIIMLIHYLSSIKIKAINPKVVVSLIFLVLVNVLLCVCQQNMHFFDYQANVYKEIRKDAMYVRDLVVPNTTNSNSSHRYHVSEFKKILKDYPNTTHYTYAVAYRYTIQRDLYIYYFSDKQFLIDGVVTSADYRKCNIIIQRDEYNYTNDYELAKENNYTYIELYGPSMTSGGTPQTNEEINQRKVLYKYLPNFNDEALTWNEEYDFTSVYIGKKKDLLKIKLNPENYSYIEYGYKERQLLYQLDNGEKLILSLGYIPILLSIILVFISYNFLVVTEGYDNKIKRLLGMKRFKFFISKIKEGLIIYFIPLIIGLIISEIYSIIKFKAGYSFIALALICGSTLILLIIIALLQLKKTYNGNLIIKK